MKQDLFFHAISDEIMKEKLQFLEKEEVTYRYADTIGNTHVTIFFTNKDRAAWIAKYKGEYYGSIISNIERQDEYTFIDIYRTLKENATKTLKLIKQ
ncbi:hypothetical protein KC902_03245 [Candidatus Kaiserbacteria bacterium]|nr:hypothetical protein [Candidatus Kaiserbacteria bacterium]